MKAFIRKYEGRIHGVLSCFDRMLFRGYLPLMSGWAMAGFLYRLNVNFGNLKPFLLENSERVNHHAISDGPKIWTAVSIPRIQHRQGWDGATTCPARRNRAWPSVHFLHP